MDIHEIMYHMARLALAGRRQDVQMFIRRVARQLQEEKPEITKKLNELLAESPTRETPLRSDELATAPIDRDSRLQLVRQELPVVLETDPIWNEEIYLKLSQIVAERAQEHLLVAEGLVPTKSILFTGPPGVGKTLAARWLAKELKRPLLTLDLAAVMSSFLGRTGANVRYVLDYAKSVESVLLLDELDSIAKRRDDSGDVGELKRLVTVLLQEIDDWPSSGLLVAATNHPDLLDPAVWRRFDMVVSFPMPSQDQTTSLITRLLSSKNIESNQIEILAVAHHGESFSEVERDVLRVMREAIVSKEPLEGRLLQMVRDKTKDLPVTQRKQIASKLRGMGHSMREVSDWTGVHRNTIKGIAAEDPGGGNEREPDANCA